MLTQPFSKVVGSREADQTIDGVHLRNVPRRLVPRPSMKRHPSHQAEDFGARFLSALTALRFLLCDQLQRGLAVLGVGLLQTISASTNVATSSRA
jgi:hypothetical protein